MLAKFRKADGGLVTAEYRKVDASPTKPYVNMDANLRVPGIGRFVQVLTWPEIAKALGTDPPNNQNPYPQMITRAHGIELREPVPDGDVYQYLSLPDKWYRFLYDWFEFQGQGYLSKEKTVTPYTRPNNWRTFYKAVPGSVMEVFIKMTEAHICWSDPRSREAGWRCPVVDVNPTMPGWEMLFNFQGGALLELDYIFGSKYVVKALDVRKDPPAVEWLAEHPQYFYFATQWGKYTGSTRFAQLKNSLAVHGIPEPGKPIPGIAMPTISMGGRIMIDKRSCSPILTNGAPWSPYKPI